MSRIQTNQTVTRTQLVLSRNLWAERHDLAAYRHPVCPSRPGLVGGNCAGLRQKIAVVSAPYVRGGEVEAMQLSQMWREHLQAGCPIEMRGLDIAGTQIGALDAEITACVSACVTHSLKMDSRIERRLQDISHALEHMEPVTPEVAAYCSRLNKLVSAVLVNAGPVVEAEKPAASDTTGDTVRMAVRPGVRRR